MALKKLPEVLIRQKWQESHIKELDQMKKTYEKKSRGSKCIKRTFLEKLADELNEWQEKFQQNSTRLTKLAGENEESFRKIFKSTMKKYEEFEKMILHDSNCIYVSKMLPKIVMDDASAGTNVTNISEANKSHKRKTDTKSKTSESPAAKKLKSGNRISPAGM